MTLNRMAAIALVAAPIIFAACREAPVAPNTPAPLASWMNNPDNGNLTIMRFEHYSANSWTDPTNGLRATHADYPVTSACGEIPFLDPIDHQWAGSFDFRLNLNEMGPVTIIIRDMTQPGDCVGRRLVAKGLGRYHYTDNNMAGMGPDNPPNNSFGYMAEGELTAPDGSKVHYNGAVRVTWRYLGGDLALESSYEETVRTVFVHLSN